jgi:hypothetical protein
LFLDDAEMLSFFKERIFFFMQGRIIFIENLKFYFYKEW